VPHGAFSRLEPCAVKVASTVLRGRGGGNVTSLPDGPGSMNSKCKDMLPRVHQGFLWVSLSWASSPLLFAALAGHGFNFRIEVAVLNKLVMVEGKD
jgi:hypothetical protein